MRAKYQKKLIVVITSLMAMLLLSSTVAFAENVTTYTQGALYYTVGDASVTITGCFGKDETVEVPASIAGNPVNTIAAGAFTGNNYVKEVILPDTIMTIEEGAFASNITVLQKQESVANIGDTDQEKSDSSDEKDSNENSDHSEESGSSGIAGNNTANGSYIVLQQGSSTQSNEAENADASSDAAVATTQEDTASDEGAAEEKDANVNEGEESGVESADAEAELNSRNTEKENQGKHSLWVVAIVAIAAAAVLCVVVWKKKKNPKQSDQEERVNETKR